MPIRTRMRNTKQFIINTVTRTLNVTETIANTVDDALERVARRPLDWLHEDTEARAMEDAQFADIESRRHDSDFGILMLSEEANLGHAEWQYQDMVRNQVRLNPWWERPCRKLTNEPFGTVVRALQFAGQRVMRGWDDRALWSLDTHLTLTLGQQLLRMADIAHGWPCTDEFPEFTDWTNALRTNGDALIAYAQRERFGDIAEEQRVSNEAVAALRWVGDHLGYLWD